MDFVLRLELTGDDLARLKIIRAADPLDEVQSAAHRIALGRRIDAPAAGWARRTAAALGPAGALILEVMGSGIGICSDLAQHRQRFAVEFDGFPESIRGVPMLTWQAEVDDLVDWGIPPGRAASMAGDRSRVDQFANVVGRFQDAALRPYWPVIQATAAAHADALSELLAISGVDAVLRNLHPWVTWDDPILTISGERGGVCAATCPHWTFEVPTIFPEPVSLEGRGLALVPSVLATGISVTKPCATDDDDRSWDLTYPVPWDWGLSVDARRHQALTDLLGATRATVLDALLGRMLTTSELARRVSISPASASEHATVLRSAGLVTSTREGARVYHSLTSMGIQLATGGAGVTFTGTVADRSLV